MTTCPNWTVESLALHCGPVTHLKDCVSIRSQHLPFVRINPVVIFALYAIQCHTVLRLHHEVQASVGHWWTVGIIWGDKIESAYITFRQPLR